MKDFNLSNLITAFFLFFEIHLGYTAYVIGMLFGISLRNRPEFFIQIFAYRLGFTVFRWTFFQYFDGSFYADLEPRRMPRKICRANRRDSNMRWWGRT